MKLAVPQKGAWDTSISEWGAKQGFFKEEGVDLDITYTEGGATTEQAVISGSVDMAVATGTLGIISAYVKGAPVRIVSAEVTGVPDMYFFARADERHQEPQGRARQDHRLQQSRLVEQPRDPGAPEAGRHHRRQADRRRRHHRASSPR